MTRVGTRLSAALIAAVLAAALLSACGGSSSTTDSSTTAEATTQNGSSDSPSGGSDSQSQNDGQSQGQTQGDGQGKQSRPQQQSGNAGGGGGSRDIAVAPLQVSGGGSGQFRSKGGDNSIQEFGEEADESELQEAAEAVHGFLVAEAREEWDKACSYLAKSNVEQLEKLASQSPQLRNGGCAPVLAAFTRPLPAAAERRITTVDAGSFRHEGEQGFLIYFGDERVTYAMPLRDEGGTWKVAALSGTTLG